MPSLDGDEHRERRKLPVPPFHGKRTHGYESIVEEEGVARSPAGPRAWERDHAGDDDHAERSCARSSAPRGRPSDELRDLPPRAVVIGSRLAVLPFFRRDLGPRSPGK